MSLSELPFFEAEHSRKGCEIENNVICPKFLVIGEDSRCKVNFCLMTGFCYRLHSNYIFGNPPHAYCPKIEFVFRHVSFNNTKRTIILIIKSILAPNLSYFCCTQRPDVILVKVAEKGAGVLHGSPILPDVNVFLSAFQVVFSQSYFLLHKANDY